MREHPLAQLLDLRNEARLSFLFDISAVQDSFRFRALSRARRLSLALLDQKGEIKREFLQNILAIFEKEGYLFYPTGNNDGLITEHFIRFLRFLDNDEAIKSLKRFQMPLVHKWAEKLIFETLGIDSASSPTDAQIKAAVLCACLTPLRQIVGSCFATAPAILIQSEQIPLLLDDLYQLITLGKLKRTFGGVEYAIPLSPSTGIGELKKNLTSAGPKAKSGFCPGLIAALEKGGIIEERLSDEEKGEAAQHLIEEFSRVKNPLTVEDLIRFSLLRKFSLAQGDLENGRRLEMAQFKRSLMPLAQSTPGALRKIEQVLNFYQKEKDCRAAFKGVCDNAFLRAWEFTLASFSEVKMEFSRWNLYSSLGLAANEVGGIGELIYQRVDEKIKETNLKLEKYQAQYQIAFDELRATESLLHNASSESEARRLQAEYQSRAYHMRTCLEIRDATYDKGVNYSNLYSFLVKQYDEKFPEYFQEIYDAEMQDFQGDLYDDSPAGFRLVYKHGRPDPSLWTLIYESDQYIESLIDFFSATESAIAAACDWKGGDQDVLELTSAIISHVKSNVFLETALQRMAKAHQAPSVKSPLAHLHSIEKKPWAYTSGGTMTTLLKTYYCRANDLTQEEKWVENETELLIFLLDTLKSLPPKVTDPYLKNPSKGMLMTSPTHAFVLIPAQEELRKGYSEDIFTYTWVRDEMFIPSQRFYSEMSLTPTEQAFLISKFSEQISLSYPIYPKEKKVSVIEWRNSFLEALIPHAIASQKRTLTDALDAFLYQHLPLVSGKEWKAVVRRILSDYMNEKVEQVMRLFPDVPAPYLTASEIRDAAKGCYLLSENKLASAFDLHAFIAKHARFVGAAQPTPVLFADTNWSGNYFGFVVNPGTGRLELWRLDRTLSQGVQMSEWKHWLNGQDPKSWSIFTRPHEYEMAAPGSTFGGRFTKI